MAQYKQVENDVRNLLNDRGYDLKPHKNNSISYDLYGVDDKGNDIIIEVKGRSKRYSKWYLEIKKADRMQAIVDKHPEKNINKIYCVVCEGEYTFYSVDEIINNNEPFEKMLPETTKFSKRHFIKKIIVEFDADSHYLKIIKNEK